MVVDFRFKKEPKRRIAYVGWKGTWQENRVRREFESLAKWLEAHQVKTGRWFFFEPGNRTFRVAIEVVGAAHGDGRVRVRTLPAAKVASVEFNPEEVSPRVVYHGITDWLRWRRKEHEIKSVGAYRETYSANPWRDAKAWAHTEVQVVVK
jgi:effector-binding domain-containing protein